MKKSRTLLTAVATFATLGISCTAFAAGLGGKADVGVGGGPDNRGAGAAVGVDAGGSVNAPPASASGATNSNGSISTDRDLGQDRAADRRSVEGQTHEKATDNVGKKKDKLRKPLPPDGDAASPVK
jgi:hypothetical protein